MTPSELAKVREMVNARRAFYAVIAGTNIDAIDTARVRYDRAFLAVEAMVAESQTVAPLEPYCVKCGHPKSNHPFRHPFVTTSDAGWEKHAREPQS